MSPGGDGRTLSALSMVGLLGCIMAASILAGFAAGALLDGFLGTSPVLTVVLLLTGIAGGMVAVYRVVMKAIEQAPPEDDGREP